MRNGRMTGSHRYVRGNCLVATPHQAAYLLWLQEELRGISPSLESDDSQAWPRVMNEDTQGSQGAAQRSASTYNMLNLPASL